MTIERHLGIDFSGNHLRWRPKCRTSNVWIVELHRAGEAIVLHDVRRVQDLAGEGEPFERLAALLASGDYVAAGIDAPFSIPDQFVRAVGGHAALLKLVAAQTAVDR